MSGGRGSRSRSSRGSNHEESTPRSVVCVASGSGQLQTCAYSERICQRPVNASSSSQFCWMHAKTEAASGHKQSKKGSTPTTAASADPPPTRLDEQKPEPPAATVVLEPSDSEKLRRLVATYVGAQETPQSGKASPLTPNKVKGAASVAAANTENQHEYLDALGAIPVDDPAGAFVTIDDSASDDGSDEFGSNAPLAHAGVYSAEEVVSMACDRMQRLRQLYVEELKQIGIQLKLSRRRYLAEVARDRRRRIGDPLTDYVPVTPEQQVAHRQLKAMRRHRRRYPSPDAVLRWYLKSKSTKPSASSSTEPPSDCVKRSPTSHNCAVSSCQETVLPLTRYCSKHILMDRRQLLFSKCPGFQVNGCEPVHGSPDATRNGELTDVKPSSATKSYSIDCERLTILNATTASRSSSSQLTTSTSTRCSGASGPSLCSTHRMLVSALPSSKPSAKPS